MASVVIMEKALQNSEKIISYNPEFYAMASPLIRKIK